MNTPRARFALLPALLSAVSVSAAIYTYTNDKGATVCVGDISKVPARYTNSVQIIGGKYDNLTPKQKAAKLNEERAAAERIRLEWTDKNKRWKQVAAAKAGREREERILKAKGAQKVFIVRNNVFVPVVLTYRGKALQVLLHLDTGASTTTIHHDVAEKLGVNFDEFKKRRFRMASGKTVRGYVGRLDRIDVGPNSTEDFRISVLKYEGRKGNVKGLLGMNFLRHHVYAIDFDRKMIFWNNSIRPDADARFGME